MGAHGESLGRPDLIPGGPHWRHATRTPGALRRFLTRVWAALDF